MTVLAGRSLWIGVLGLLQCQAGPRRQVRRLPFLVEDSLERPFPRDTEANTKAGRAWDWGLQTQVLVLGPPPLFGYVMFGSRSLRLLPKS